MRDIATKVNGTTTLDAGDFNANLGSEIENFVTATDQTLDAAGGPDTGGLEMMGKAAAAYANAGAVYQDSGAANAYVLAIASNLKSITKYFTGLRVTFKPGNTNTGASTVNIATIGVKSITLPDGTALSAGMIISGEYITLIYNLSDDRFEVSVLTQKAVRFESLELIIELKSTTTVDVDAERLSLLDSSNIPAYIDDLDLTFTMPTDLEAGTSEKASHWYGMWVDSDLNKRLVPDLTGSADGTTGGFLDDSSSTFATDLVKVGDIARNRTDGTKTTVATAATVDGNPLDVVDDIFVSGDDYEIIKMSPEGLGEFRERIGKAYNGSGSDLTKVLKNGQARITTAFWHTVNGYGSSSTKIQKFTTEVDASDDVVVTISNSATLGFTITANMNCFLFVNYGQLTDSINASGGISKNSSELTTNVQSITTADIMAIEQQNLADNPTQVAWEGEISTNDIIRPHSDGLADGSAPGLGRINVIAKEII